LRVYDLRTLPSDDRQVLVRPWRITIMNDVLRLLCIQAAGMSSGHDRQQVTF
jgi:hypothetical protein